MSYILDALQEAQKNRDDGTVPDLTSVHEASKPARRVEHRWGYLAGIVILVVSGLLIWWLSEEWSSDPEPLAILEQAAQTSMPHDSAINDSAINDTAIKSTGQGLEETPLEGALPTEDSSTIDNSGPEVIASPSAVSSTTVITTPSSAKNAVITAPPETTSAKDGLSQVQSQAVSSFEPPHTDKQVMASTETEPGANELPGPSLKVAAEDAVTTPGLIENSPKSIEKKVDNVVVNERMPVDAQPGKAPLESVVAIETAPLRGNIPVGAGEQDQQDGAQSKDQDKNKEPQVIEPAPRLVPHFRELPFDIQQSLPPIKYSVHLYAAKPEHRMVKIDGLLRREGDTVKTGLVLEEITPTGAIFSFKNKIFRVPVNG